MNSILFDISYRFIITPCIEYFVHRILHKINSTIHKTHHIEVKNNINEIELYILPFLAISIYNEYNYLAIGILKYMIIHNMLHTHPDLLPSHLVNNHNIHHKFNNHNYGISSIYPDLIFNTNLIKKKKKKNLVIHSINNEPTNNF